MANIVRFDPFDELTRLQRDMTRLFDDSLTGRIRPNQENGSNGGSSRIWAPVVDIREDANEVIVHADLPGVKHEDIDIEVTGDLLTLRGERKYEETENKKNYVRVERTYGSFQRTFQIGVPVQSDKVSAEFKDGVLTIHLPKSEETRPKKITVNVN